MSWTRGRDDIVCGGRGHDSLSGWGGDDVPIGGEGATGPSESTTTMSFLGGAGRDVMTGGAGGQLGVDRMDGGSGDDRPVVAGPVRTACPAGAATTSWGTTGALKQAGGSHRRRPGLRDRLAPRRLRVRRPLRRRCQQQDPGWQRGRCPGRRDGPRPHERGPGHDVCLSGGLRERCKSSPKRPKGRERFGTHLRRSDRDIVGTERADVLVGTGVGRDRGPWGRI
jgi:hypothetical protein